MVELVMPLAITVLVVQNGQGIAILTASGHRPPTNAITVVCGAASIVTAFFGAVSTCLTGPVERDPREFRGDAPAIYRRRFPRRSRRLASV